MNPELTTCPFCSAQIGTQAFFCPVCGKKIKDKPLAVDLKTKVLLYGVSILLPPLGLGWTIRYVRSADSEAKKMGIISLVLTVVSLLAAVGVTMVYVQSLTKQINEMVNQYQNLEY
jgi:hypothetical protein